MGVHATGISMWELYLAGLFVLVGGFCYYCPYQCLTMIARGRQAIKRLTLSPPSDSRWEGSTTDGTDLIKQKGGDAVPDWDVCFRVLTTADGVDAYVPRNVSSLPPRKTLPFFQTVVRLTSGEDCDVSSTISMFAYEGNDIGGLIFWRWFLLRFLGCEAAGNVDCVRVLDASTFMEKDLDLSASLKL